MRLCCHKQMPRGTGNRWIELIFHPSEMNSKVIAKAKRLYGYLLRLSISFNTHSKQEKKRGFLKLVFVPRACVDLDYACHPQTPIFLSLYVQREFLRSFPFKLSGNKRIPINEIDNDKHEIECTVRLTHRWKNASCESIKKPENKIVLRSNVKCES